MADSEPREPGGTAGGAPEALLEALLQAAAANDSARLQALCQAHQEAVLRHFDEWRRVPAGMRAQPAALDRYALGLMAVAQCFDKQLHRPELLRLLIGTEASNPLTLWQHRLADVRRLFKQLRYGDAKDLLTKLYPGRVVVQVNIDPIAAGGGGIHCVTKNLPAI